MNILAKVGCALDALGLEPLDVKHAGGLIEAATAETFEYFSRGPTPFTERGMEDFIEYLLGPAATVPFCIVLPESGEHVGISTYLDIRPQHRGVEIGWTWIAERCRSSRVNPAMKLLLLGHAFEHLDAIRVCLKTDERNTLCKAAIEKLGAQREGIFRHALIMPDGFRRSSVMYSILAQEWPGVRARLEARGIDDDQLGRIHGPIGLDIGARTPAEIALAILAEIIDRLRKPVDS